MNIKTFDPDNCTLVLAYVANDGTQDQFLATNWESCAVRYSDPRAEHSTSTTGQITRSKIKNKLGVATLMTPNNSDVCSFLAKYLDSSGKLVLQFLERQDESTITEMFLGDATITDAGDLEKARISGMRTWTLTGALFKPKENVYAN